MQKLIKSRLMYFIFGVTIAIGITSVFAYSIFAPDVGFTPRDDTWDVENTKDALDDLHETCTYCKTRFENLVWNYPYEGEEQSFPVPLPGIYKLEVWGAQGGNASSSFIGGYGGFATGYVELNKGDELYINVGGQGDSSGKAGYNGGGKGTGYTSQGNGGWGAGGGGATHIAFSSGVLSSLVDRKDDILIVAGGGGGSIHYSDNSNGTTPSGSGGHGGGYIGHDGFHNNWTTSVGHGGTQTAGGAGQSSSCNSGTFGQGAAGGGCYGNNEPGGGGGYYGGGSSRHSGAGGGSSYIASSLLISTNSMTKHTTCYKCTTSDDDSTKTYTTDDVENKPQPDKAKMGNGYARITLMFVK